MVSDAAEEEVVEGSACALAADGADETVAGVVVVAAIAVDVTGVPDTSDGEEFIFGEESDMGGDLDGAAVA